MYLLFLYPCKVYVYVSDPDEGHKLKCVGLAVKSDLTLCAAGLFLHFQLAFLYLCTLAVYLLCV